MRVRAPHVAIIRNMAGQAAIHIEGDIPQTLTLTVMTPDETVVFSETVLPIASVVGDPAATPRVTQVSPEVWGITLGDPAAAVNATAQSETNVLQDYLLLWQVDGQMTVQKVRIVSAAMWGLAADFRPYLDKALKPYDALSSHPSFIGFDDPMLMEFLLGGLSLINDFQPSPTWSCVELFPGQHRSLLFDAALYYAIMSQQMFAIDTDLQNWGDQGNSWVMDHFPKLAQVAQSIYATLTTRVPAMKLRYISWGSVRTEVAPSYRLNVLVSSAPQGALFRGVLLSTGA